MIINTRINAKEVTVGSQKFCAFTTKINNTWYKVKFTQECEKSPKVRGVYELTFDTKNSSIQRGKKYTKKDGTEGTGNDIIWIHRIDKISKYTDEELASMNAKEVENILGFVSNVDCNEELPF